MKDDSGVFIFAFIKVPCFIWENIFSKNVWKLIKSIARMCLLCAVWLLLVFGVWMAFDLHAFIAFWSMVGRMVATVFVGFWKFACAYANGAWVTVALLGSVYGLFYVSMKQRKSRGEGDAVASEKPVTVSESEPASVSKLKDSELKGSVGSQM